MKLPSFHILRVGMAVTFLWIGVLIFREPLAWGSYLQPWAVDFLLIPMKEAMIGTALLDILIGVLLLVDVLTWLAALIGALHMVVVLAVSGITTITVRDIALLAGLIALMTTSWPDKFKFWRKRGRT